MKLPVPWYHAGRVHAAQGRHHRAILAIFCLHLGGLGACAPARLTTPVGMSDAVPEPPHTAKPEPTRPPWVEFTNSRGWPLAAPPFTATAHHRSGTLLEIRVEPSALAAYQSLAVDAPMPDGARVVAWQKTPDGQLLGGFELEKRAGTWSARELDPSGAVPQSDTASCLRCHDMAPTDHLFGLLRPPAATGNPREREAIGPEVR